MGRLPNAFGDDMRWKGRSGRNGGGDEAARTDGVDLVVEGEALVDGDAALRELEDAARRAHEDHLLVGLRRSAQPNAWRRAGGGVQGESKCQPSIDSRRGKEGLEACEASEEKEGEECPSMAQAW
eukprot:5330317-Pleurochrysis_carterae.AAC.1